MRNNKSILCHNNKQIKNKGKKKMIFVTEHEDSADY